MAIRDFHQLLAKDIQKGLEKYAPNKSVIFEDISSLVKDAITFLTHKNQSNIENHRETYRNVVELLVASRVAKPILALDWSVDRQDDADLALGGRRGGILRLRDILTQRDPSYGMNHIHLDKGPGDCSMVNRFRNTPVKDIDGNNKQTPFIHVGIGDSLYFVIDGILLQCIEKKHEKNPYVKSAINILSQMIQLKLRDRWYDPERTNYAIGEWKAKDDASFDLNDIYIALNEIQNDDKIVEEIFNIESGQVTASKIFEGDDKDSIDINTWSILLTLLGKKPREIQNIFSDLVLKVGKMLKILKNELEKELKKTESSENTTKINLRKSKLKKLVKDYESFYNALQSNFQVGSNLDLGSNEIKSIKDIFSRDFNSSMKRSGKSYKAKNDSEGFLNLNRLPEIFFEDFVLGYFTNIRNIFEREEQFMLVTEIRSSSHENDENFKKDLYNSLKKLTAGGVIWSDGLNESFSGRSRIKMIDDMLSKLGDEYKAEVVYDPNNKKTKALSVLIQRRSNYGYLTEEEKESFINQGWESKGIKPMEIIPISNAIQYASIYIENTIREKLINRFGILKLQGLHWMMPILKKEVLAGTGIKHDEVIKDKETKELLELEINSVLKLSHNVSEDINEKMLKVTSKTTEVLNKGSVLTYQRISNEESNINTSTTTLVTNLPNNADLIGGIESLSGDIEVVKERLINFRDYINSKQEISGYKPMVFLAHQDCSINICLIDRLEELFGVEFVKENVQILPINFEQTSRASEETIRDLEAINNGLELHKKHGGIILGGGSWTAAYQVTGQSVNKYIASDIIDAMEDNSKLKFVGICNFFQVMMDVIGEKYEGEDIKTRPGTMQFGSTHVKVEGEESSHPIFEGIPSDFTVSQTHADWVTGIGKIDNKVSSIATDVATGNPIACEAMEGQFIGMQFHPELDATNKETLAAIEYELSEYDNNFKTIFGVGSKEAMEGFYSAQKHLRGDVGPHIIINTLKYLSEDLSK